MLNRIAKKRTAALLILAAAMDAAILLAQQPSVKSQSSREEAVRLPERGVCAHRGASATHPENTLSALREAVRLGVQMIEFDLAMTKDGQLVLMHDATIDRTTNGSGRVADFTLAELQRLDAGSWHSPEHAGQHVPTFVEALNVMPANIWLNVHLKGGVQLAEGAAQQLHDSERLHQAFLACDRASAHAAKRIAPEIQICNMERQESPAVYARMTVADRAQFIQLLGRRRGALDQITYLQQHSVRINYCCTNDPEELRLLFAAGVQFPLVDRVGEMLKVAEQLGIRPIRPVLRREIKE